jgi:hypothetical protein
MRKSRKLLPIIIIIFSAAIVTIASSVTGQNYQQVTTITGSNTQTTDYFKIPSGEWRVKWSYTPSTDYPSFAVFSVFVYPKGETTMFVESIIQSGANNTSGVTYIHQGNREYYMKINAANINGYTIIIEAEQPQPSPTIPEIPLGFATAFLAAFITASIIIITKKRR